jgi:hypothetical protein
VTIGSGIFSEQVFFIRGNEFSPWRELMKKCIPAVLMLLALSALSILRCSECPGGRQDSCVDQCSVVHQSAASDCNLLYGPTGADNPVLLAKCKSDAEDAYDRCYDNCPCEETERSLWSL